MNLQDRIYTRNLKLYLEYILKHEDLFYLCSKILEIKKDDKKEVYRITELSRTGRIFDIPIYNNHYRIYNLIKENEEYLLSLE